MRARAYPATSADTILTQPSRFGCVALALTRFVFTPYAVRGPTPQQLWIRRPIGTHHEDPVSAGDNLSPFDDIEGLELP